MTANRIQAIETTYNGVKYRSRTEARWRIFFDDIGLHVDYEREGYDVPDVGYYLPDFWVRDWNMHVEIKGTFEEAVEADRVMERLCVMDGNAGVVFFGQPMEHYGQLVAQDFTDSSGGHYGGDWNALIGKIPDPFNAFDSVPGLVLVGDGRERQFYGMSTENYLDYVVNENNCNVQAAISRVRGAAQKVMSHRFW